MSEPMALSVEDEENFDKSHSCYVCRSVFMRNSDKCRDHNHTTGYNSKIVSIGNYNFNLGNIAEQAVQDVILKCRHIKR